MKPCILPVKRDIIFKIFFSDERNIEFLTDFLKATLKIPAEEYREITIVDPHLIREHPTDKLGIVDVKLKTVSGKTIHIEIQVEPLDNMRQRIAYYDAKMITEQLGVKERYEDIKQVISIVITEKDFIPESPHYHHRFTLYDSANDVELTDIVEVHTLELGKLPDEAPGDRLWRWLRFIKAEGEIELEAAAKKDPLIQQAVVRLMELSADERTRLLYEAREKERMDMADRLGSALKKGRAEGKAEGRAEGKAEGRAEGKAEGRAEGKAEGRVDVARNLLKMNLPLNQISAATGLTREEIEKLG